MSTEAVDPRWDEFVARTATAHHEQTASWGHAQRLAGWRAVRLVVRAGGEIVGGAQVLERPVGPGLLGWTVGYLNRGPLVMNEDPALRTELVRALRRHARRRRMVYLAATLPYDGELLEKEFLASGFAASPDALPPSTAMKSTSVLDLAPTEEELLAAMRAKTRQHLRKALKSGLTVRHGGAGDLATFERLLEALCARRGVRSNVPGGGFVTELWEKFAADGRLRLFLLEKDGEIVAAMLVFATGRWVRAWRFGWSGDHAEVYPTELIYWEAIKWARAGGYRFFDFSGFDTKYARALAEGRTLAAGEICKISFFKQGFGGRIMPLFPGYCFFQNPILRFAFKVGGGRFLESGLFKKLARSAGKRGHPPA